MLGILTSYLWPRSYIIILLLILQNVLLAPTSCENNVHYEVYVYKIQPAHLEAYYVLMVGGGINFCSTNMKQDILKV